MDHTPTCMKRQFTHESVTKLFVTNNNHCSQNACSQQHSSTMHMLSIKNYIRMYFLLPRHTLPTNVHTEPSPRSPHYLLDSRCRGVKCGGRWGCVHSWRLTEQVKLQVSSSPPPSHSWLPVNDSQWIEPPHIPGALDNFQKQYITHCAADTEVLKCGGWSVWLTPQKKLRRSSLPPPHSRGRQVEWDNRRQWGSLRRVKPPPHQTQKPYQWHHLTPHTCVNSIGNVGLGRWGVEWKPYHQPHHTSWSDNRWERGNVCSCVLFWEDVTFCGYGVQSYTAHSHDTVH